MLLFVDEKVNIKFQKVAQSYVDVGAHVQLESTEDVSDEEVYPTDVDNNADHQRLEKFFDRSQQIREKIVHHVLQPHVQAVEEAEYLGDQLLDLGDDTVVAARVYGRDLQGEDEERVQQVS